MEEDCIHVKGFFDNRLVLESQWKEVKESADKKLDFYFKNIDAAIMYGIQTPQRIIEFRFCPSCGKEL